MKKHQLGNRRCTSLVSLLALLLIAVLPASAAYQMQRPITYDGGRLNQSYLYGEEWDTSTHKGVDFSYDLDTHVYATADGTVVDLYEDYDDGDDRDPLGWGNRVLIRHSARHWDRTTQQWAYVYSIYAHLSKDSVRYSIGQFVYAGNWIADVDDTGYSSGNHLHLQICIHPQSDRTIGNLSSSTTSRNPELWLQAFNSGGTNTGTAVGKVTDTDGQPIGDRYIWGLSKPQGSGGTNYVSSRTYAYTWANPDDILVENWGTTDVLPGTYHLTVRNASGTTTYEDLGWHTVEAGKTTYVGLYPVYLPDIMENYYNWSSSIRIRNNSDSKTAQVNTTFFRYDGAWVYGQKTDYIPPRGTVKVDFPGSCYYCRGSAMVVASEDVSVVVKNDGPDGVTSYTGIGVQGGSTGWDEPGQTVYVPASLRNYYGWDSVFYIQNAWSGDTSGSITFYNEDGTPKHTEPDLSISANGQERVRLDGISDLGDGFFGSAVISFDRPVAVVVRQEGGSSGYSDFNAFTSGADVLYLPSLLNGYYGWDSAYQVQNVGTQAASISVRYEFGILTVYNPLASCRPKAMLRCINPQMTASKAKQSGRPGSPAEVTGRLWLSSTNRTALEAIKATVPCWAVLPPSMLPSSFTMWMTGTLVCRCRTWTWLWQPSTETTTALMEILLQVEDLTLLLVGRARRTSGVMERQVDTITRRW